MIRFYSILSLLQASFFIGLLSNASLAGDCITPVEFAGMVQAISLKTLVASGHGRFLRAATYANSIHRLFHFNVMNIGSQVAVIESLTGVIALPLKGNHLIFYIPGLPGTESSSAIAEVGSVDNAPLTSLIRSSCNTHCLDRLSLLFSQQVLPKYLPTAIEVARARLHAVNRSLEFESEFDPFVKLLGKNWVVNRDSAYTAFLPSEAGTLVRTPIQLQIEFEDDLVFKSNSSIRIPVASLEHARLILDQLGTWMSAPGRIAAWDEREDFRFANNLRAKFEEETQDSPAELRLHVVAKGDSWNKDSERAIILKRLFEILLNQGQLQKPYPFENYLLTRFGFQPYSLSEGSNGIYEPNWGLYFVPTRNGLNVGVMEGGDIQWTSFPMPSQFHIWQSLIKAKLSQSHVYGFAEFVDKVVLPKLMSRYFEFIAAEVKKMKNLPWATFTRLLQWLEWSAKRSPHATRTENGGLFEFILDDRVRWLPLTTKVRINMDLTGGAAFSQILLGVPPSGSYVRKLAGRLELAMGEREAIVDVRETFEPTGDHVARFSSDRGLIADVYDPARSSGVSEMHEGFGARPGDWIVDLYPAIGRFPLTVPSAKGEAWRLLFEAILSEGKLRPL